VTKKLKRNAYFLSLVLWISAGQAVACTCVGFGPACSEAVSPNVAAVFLGTVKSIERTAGSFVDKRTMSMTGGGLVAVKFDVQEAYKGVTLGSATILTAASEAACGFPFEVAQQYVVYAVEYNGALYTSICQRTLPLRVVAGDLVYVRSLKALPGTSQVFGTYKKYTYDPSFVPKHMPSIMDHYLPPEEDYVALAPLAGETVTLTPESGPQLKATVGENGKFVFDGVQPGKYKIDVTVPSKLAPPRGYASGLGFRLDALQLVPGGCVEVTFRTEPDGHIAGRILNADDTPLPNVEVVAWKSGEEFNLYRGVARVNNSDDGTFDLGPLPPGKYIIGAHVWVLPQGFPGAQGDRDRLTKATLHFFPDTQTFNEAKPITLEYGQHVVDIHLKIPFEPAAWKDVRGSH